MDNIIQMILQAREDNDTLEFENEELDRRNYDKKQHSNQLYSFIDEKAHPNIRDDLKRMIEEYCDDTANISFQENRLYYQKGFSDGLKIIVTALTL